MPFFNPTASIQQSLSYILLHLYLLATMPSLPSGISVITYRKTNELPKDVWCAIESGPRNANVILPQILKARADEKAYPDKGNTTWITCSSHSAGKVFIEFILSVTDGYMGTYPVFIFTTLPFHALTDDHIRPCVTELVKALKAAVPHSRVYSIFAAKPIALLFAEEWTRSTGVTSYTTPYYDAKISYCDKRPMSLEPSHEYDLRLAKFNDIPAIAELCFLFAAESASFCFVYRISVSKVYFQYSLRLN